MPFGSAGTTGKPLNRKSDVFPAQSDAPVQELRRKRNDMEKTEPENQTDEQEWGTALGRHLTAEFHDCSSSILADAKKLEELFLTAAKVSGATVVASHFHSFSPQGVSGVVIISESHFAVHAWPEHDYAAVDLFTCGDSVDFGKALDCLAKGMQCGRLQISSLMNRGVLPADGSATLSCEKFGEGAASMRSWKERFLEDNARAISILVDRYQCKTTASPGELLLQLAGKLHFRGEGSAPVAIGSRRWALALEKGTLSLRFPGDGNAYLDCFLEAFSAPRSLATAALELLQGEYYRLQVQIRR